MMTKSALTIAIEQEHKQLLERLENVRAENEIINSVCEAKLNGARKELDKLETDYKEEINNEQLHHQEKQEKWAAREKQFQANVEALEEQVEQSTVLAKHHSHLSSLYQVELQRTRADLLMLQHSNNDILAKKVENIERQAASERAEQAAKLQECCDKALVVTRERLALDQQVKSLKKENEQLSQDNQAYIDKLDKMGKLQECALQEHRTNHIALQGEKHVVENRLQERERHITVQKQQLRELQDELTTAATRVLALESRLREQAMRHEVEQTRTRLEAQEKVNSYRMEQEATSIAGQDKEQELQWLVSSLHRQIELQDAENAELKANLASLTQAADQNESSHKLLASRLGTRIKQLEGERKAKDMGCEKLLAWKQQTECLQQQVQQLQSELTGAKQELGVESSKVAQLTAGMEEHREKCRSLEERLASKDLHSTCWAKQETSLATLKERIDRLNQEVAQGHQRYAVLQRKYQMKKTMLAQEVRDGRDKLDEMRRELELLRAESMQLKRDVPRHVHERVCNKLNAMRHNTALYKTFMQMSDLMVGANARQRGPQASCPQAPRPRMSCMVTDGWHRSEMVPNMPVPQPPHADNPISNGYPVNAGKQKNASFVVEHKPPPGPQTRENLQKTLLYEEAICNIMSLDPPSSFPNGHNFNPLGSSGLINAMLQPPTHHPPANFTSDTDAENQIGGKNNILHEATKHQSKATHKTSAPAKSTIEDTFSHPYPSPNLIDSTPEQLHQNLSSSEMKQASRPPRSLSPHQEQTSRAADWKNLANENSSVQTVPDNHVNGNGMAPEKSGDEDGVSEVGQESYEDRCNYTCKILNYYASKFLEGPEEKSGSCPSSQHALPNLSVESLCLDASEPPFCASALPGTTPSNNTTGESKAPNVSIAMSAPNVSEFDPPNKSVVDLEQSSNRSGSFMQNVVNLPMQSMSKVSIDTKVSVHQKQALNTVAKETQDLEMVDPASEPSDVEMKEALNLSMKESSRTKCGSLDQLIMPAIKRVGDNSDKVQHGSQLPVTQPRLSHKFGAGSLRLAPLHQPLPRIDNMLADSNLP